MDLESLTLLETKITQFVDQHEQVRAQREALLQRLQEKEEQLATCTAQLRQYEEERSELRMRLDRILSRLEGLNLA